MEPCGNPSSHLSYTYSSSAYPVPEQRIQDSAIAEFTNDRFEALHENQIHAM